MVEHPSDHREDRIIWIIRCSMERSNSYQWGRLVGPILKFASTFARQTGNLKSGHRPVTGRSPLGHRPVESNIPCVCNKTPHPPGWGRRLGDLVIGRSGDRDIGSSEDQTETKQTILRAKPTCVLSPLKQVQENHDKIEGLWRLGAKRQTKRN